MKAVTPLGQGTSAASPGLTRLGSLNKEVGALAEGGIGAQEAFLAPDRGGLAQRLTPAASEAPAAAMGQCPECGAAMVPTPRGASTCASCGTSGGGAPVQEKRLPGPVQRFGLEDVIPDNILQRIRGLAGAAASYASGLTSQGGAAVSSGESQVAAVPAQAQGTLDRAASAATRQGETAQGQVDSGAQGAQQESTVAAASGLQRAQATEGAKALAADATDPVRSRVGAAGAPPGPPAREDAKASPPDGAETMKKAAAGDRPAGAWNCDEAAIVAKVTSMGEEAVAALTEPIRGVPGGSDALAFASREMQHMTNGIRRIGMGVDTVVSDVSSYLSENTAGAREKVAQLEQAGAAALDTAKTLMAQEVANTRKGAAEICSGIGSSVSSAVEQAISVAKSGAAGIEAQARGLAQGFWEQLEAWGLAGPIEAAAQQVEGSAAVVRADVGKVSAAAEQAATVVAQGAQTTADFTMGELGNQYVKMKGVAEAATSVIAQEAETTKNGVLKLGGAAKDEIEGRLGVKLGDLQAAAEEQAAKARGEACTLAADWVGPCVDKALPEPSGSGKAKSFRNFELGAAVTLPVGNVTVKLGGGTKVLVEKEGDKYTATLTGEGTAVLPIELGGGEEGGTSVKLDLEGQAADDIENKIRGMRALGSKRPMPGLALEHEAPAGDPEGPAGHGPGKGGVPKKGGPAKNGGGDKKKEEEGAGGAETGAKAEAGVKVELESVYKFDAGGAKRNSCEGLGGLSALMAAQGASSMLPLPFSEMAKGAATSFLAMKPDSSKIKLLATGGVEGEAKAAGLAGKLKGETEGGVEIGTKKDEQGNKLITLGFPSKGVLEGGIDLAPPGFNLGGIAGALELSRNLEISLDPKTGAVDAELSHEAKASVALTRMDLLLAHVPGGVAQAARAELERLGVSKDTHEGKLELEVWAKIGKGSGLLKAVDAELSKGSAATLGNLWKAVAEWFAKERKGGWKLSVVATKTDLKVNGELGTKGKYGLEVTGKYEGGVSMEVASGGDEKPD